jgi:integrase
MPLTDAKIRKAKPTEKTQRLFDGGGLYLEISPAGGRWWRWKYRRPVTKKENRLSFGTYPEVGLADARARRDAARKLLAAGIDPGEQRKAETAAGSERAANSFEVIAREWFAKQSPTWAPSHGSRIIDRLERDLFPWIGGRPIADITAKELLATVTRIADRGAVETAHRALQNCGQVFRYAIATGRTERNPAPDLRGALPPVKPNHLAAITAPSEIGGLLRAIESYQGSFITKCALRLAPLTFVRPGELRQAEWSEIDLASAEWNIPGPKMKMGEPHLVPLSPQAVDILRELHALTGGGRYVFPSPRTNTRPMSNMAVVSALRRMGYAKDEMTGHGFRAMARTVLDQELGFRIDYVEHQLAHNVRDPLGRAYNRTTHLPERRKMMAAWANYLDQLRDNTGNVLPFKRTASGDDR